MIRPTRACVMPGRCSASRGLQCIPTTSGTTKGLSERLEVGCRTGSDASSAASQHAGSLRSPASQHVARRATCQHARAFSRPSLVSISAHYRSALTLPALHETASCRKREQRTALADRLTICQAREAGVLIHALLEARDLLSKLFYLVFEIFLSAPHAGVTGLENVAQGAQSVGRCIAQETDRDVEAAECRLAGRTGCGGRGEGS